MTFGSSSRRVNLSEIDVLDLFCGCGGTSAGFVAAQLPGAKFRLIGGVDIDHHALKTYAANLDAPALRFNLRRVSGNEYLCNEMMSKTLRKLPNPLFLVGCSPCQGFSSHTKMAGAEDSRRNLLPHFAKIVALLKPDAILMENVPELFADRNWKYFKAAKKTLEEAGYLVRARIYNFAEFGLPQERFRTIVMAFKGQFEMPRPFLGPREFRTVREAIGHLPLLSPGERNPSDPMHITSAHRKTTIELLSKVPKDGGNRPPGVGPKCLDKARGKFGGYTDVYGRLAWGRAALTITARCRTPSCGRFAHPEQNRGLSVREAALLQGFSPDYRFEGPFDDKFKQIGNAVPPIIAKHIAEHMFAEFCRIRENNHITVDLSSDIQASIGHGFSILINGIKKRRNDAQRAFCN
jgi:DNA (cytosine-5)-methyltransferase 1